MADITILKKETYEVLKPEWLKQSGLDEAKFSKEVSFAIQLLSNNTYLQGASKESLLKAVMNVAQVGLTLNPVSKLAYLVPRYNSQKKCLEAVLDPSYQGYVKLLTDSKSVVSIQCHPIYENDDVEIDFVDANKVKKHVPYFLAGKKERGETRAYYSIATLHDGSKHIEIMSYQDILDIRERSESYKSFRDGKTKSCIWITDEGEMCRKTVIKRHYKYLPKSGNLERLERAIGLDNNVNGLKPSDGKLMLIETLIHNAAIDDEQKARLEENIDDLSDLEADRVISHLSENQKKNMDQQLDNALRIN